MLKKYNQSIQKFGRTLLLPIGVMAPVGMVMGITGAFVQSYMIERFPVLGNPVINTTLVSIRSIASIVFDNIPLLFAMGVAYGMSKRDKGIAVFSSVIGYLVMLIAMNVWLQTTGNLADPDTMSQVGQIQVLGIQTLNINALGGIIAGLIAAWATDRFYNLQLPVAFAFFAGKKSVSIICIGIMAFLGVTIPWVWQFLVAGLTKLSVIFLSPVGPFFTAAGERAFIPFGLHHLWNSLFRFTEAGGTYVINGETYVGVVPAMTEILFNLGPSSEYWDLMPSPVSYTHLILFPSAITNSMSVLLLPAVAQAQSLGNRNQITAAVTMSLRYSLYMGIFCIGIFTRFGNDLGMTVFRDENAGHFIATLSWFCPFLYLSSTTGSILNGLGKTGTTFLQNVASLLLRLGFVFFGIPRFGIAALLWGMLASEIFLAFIHLISLSGSASFQWNAWSMIAKPAALMVLSFGILNAILSIPAAAALGRLHPFAGTAVKIGITALCYGGFLLLFHRPSGRKKA